MSLTDPIADMLTMLRNGSSAKREKVDVPASKMAGEILKVLKRENFITDYRFIEDRKQGILRVYLKFTEGRRPVITSIKRISKPSLRVFAKHGNIPRVLGGLGVAIITTSKGLLTDKEARARGVGGEVLCFVW